MDPFVGTWTILLCAGPSDIEALLKGAQVSIAKDVATWTLGGAVVPGSTTHEGGKLWGELSLNGTSYYYEIVSLTPPPPISAKPYTYGIFSQIYPNEGGGGDLGDPGVWKAEESGTPPPG